MDDATRATIRKEFKSRITRAMIALPLASAMLLTMWLADKHRSHYLWLTLLPLVFTVPLYRYYLAIRRLTEPESSAPDPTTPVDVTAANAFKARMRSKATFGFGITAAILILLSSYVLGVGSHNTGELSRIDNKLVLNDHYLRVSQEFFRFWTEQGTLLTVYQPPERADERVSWSESIESHFGFPVSVFLINRSELSWERNLPLPAVREPAERKIAGPDSSREKPLRIYGSTQIRGRSFKVDTTWYTVWIAERVTDGTKWGAVFASDNTWLEFFKRLNQPGAQTDAFSSTELLNHVIALPGTTMPEHLTGLRAFLDDSLIFASPDLDLSCDSLRAENLPGHRLEFFAAPQGRGRSSQWLVNRTILIPLTLLPLLLIIPLYLSYRRVRMLTNPD